MTELSPAAQAVLDAALPHMVHRYSVAAVLRVISEFVRMDQPLGDTDADAGVFTAHQFIHGYIAAIADELEAQKSIPLLL